MVSTKESALFVFCPRPTTTYKKSRPSHIPICLNNHHKTDVFPFFYFHRNFSVVTIHKHLCIIKSQSMLFSIFFRRKSFFKEMTDLAKSYIFDLILYREDKLIILGINFDQYLIFFFGTGFVCIVDQGSNNLDQVVFGNAGNDFFVPHADNRSGHIPAHGQFYCR